MRDLDISDSISDTLLLELLSGTTTYFKESYHEKSIEDLISNVTSKGGTTEAGLKYFKDNHLDSLLGNVIQKAKKRSEEMGE
jgi:pyrroline-5-carboxylate reductase